MMRRKDLFDLQVEIGMVESVLRGLAAIAEYKDGIGGDCMNVCQLAIEKLGAVRAGLERLEIKTA